VKKRSITLALCCSLVCSPAWAKTFVGILYPLFGPVAAIGLVELAAELRSTPDVEVATYLHHSWPSLVDDINRQPKGTHILVVGYSLGANNAILVANNTNYIDSIIALQPSMLTSNPGLTGNVGRIIEIYNPNRWMTFGGMGSQKLEGPKIEYIVNNDSHPGAQFNSEFRSLVKNEIARLSADLKAAQTKKPEPSRLTKSPKAPESPKLEAVKEQRPERQATARTAFVDALSNTVSSENLLVQRTLTITDMKDYVKRNVSQEERPEHQPKERNVFHDAFSNSVYSANLSLQRQLTIGDMKDYIKRNYRTLPTIDLTIEASD
jgi:hypothetical protein